MNARGALDALARWMVRHLQSDHRVWGEALLAEGARLRGIAWLRWIAGLVPVFVLDRARVMWRAWMVRGVVYGLALGAAVAADIVVSNVIVQERNDNSIEVLLVYLGVFAALFAVGAYEAVHARDVRTAVSIGAVSALAMVVVAMATFAAVDNVWIDVVARQPQKAQAFAHSGWHSLRAYLDVHLAMATAVLAPLFTVAGALLAAAGARVVRSRVGGTPTR